jgi:hypothetical protein
MGHSHDLDLLERKVESVVTKVPLCALNLFETDPASESSGGRLLTLGWAVGQSFPDEAFCVLPASETDFYASVNRIVST